MNENFSEPRPYTFDRVVRIIFSVLLLLGSLYLIYVLRDVLLPFLVACLLAYMMEPLVKWNQRWTHLRRRFLPVMLTLMEVLAFLTLFGYIFIPYLTTEMAGMAKAIEKFYTTQVQVPYISRQIHEFVRENLDLNEISRWMSQDEWKALARNALHQSWTLISSSVAFLFSVISWLIVFLYLIFIMLDYDRLATMLRQLVPVQHRHRTFRILDDVKTAMNRYFRGQTLIAFCVGILFSIGFLIIGLPMAVVMGLFIGLLNMVPYLQLVSFPITALLCLVGYISNGADFWVLFWEAMAVYAVVQCIQDLVLTPKIMGSAMGLNPAIILLSLSVWGTLLGFIGLIIALPLTTLILSYYDLYVVQRVQRKAILFRNRRKAKQDAGNPEES